MKVMSKIELEFAGVTLPIGQDEEGRDVVPLKPISDVFGLDWERQRVKAWDKYSVQFFGTCTQQMLGADQRREMVCIRVDRVAAWLFRLNPNSVRAVGNEVGADFLIQKHEEWADLLHEYESRKGGLLQSAGRDRAVNLRLFLAVLREKRVTESAADRMALASVAGTIAAELGVSYQPDLPGTE